VIWYRRYIDLVTLTYNPLTTQVLSK